MNSKTITITIDESYVQWFLKFGGGNDISQLEEYVNEILANHKQSWEELEDTMD